jgi:hypothetical protein
VTEQLRVVLKMLITYEILFLILTIITNLVKVIYVFKIIDLTLSIMNLVLGQRFLLSLPYACSLWEASIPVGVGCCSLKGEVTGVRS